MSRKALPKVILLNGPPRSGKGSIAKYLITAYPQTFQKQSFAEPLKIGCNTLLGMDDTSEDRFEDCKDEPRVEFFGAKPREFWINVAERYMKPTFGPSCFGHIWLRKYQERLLKHYTVVVPDAGFPEEVEPVITAMGSENILLVKLYRDGYSFAHDSRGYLDNVMPFQFVHKLQNEEGHLDRLFYDVEQILGLPQSADFS